MFSRRFLDWGLAGPTGHQRRLGGYTFSTTNRSAGGLLRTRSGLNTIHRVRNLFLVRRVWLSRGRRLFVSVNADVRHSMLKEQICDE
jgi:hypothetical protein